MDVHLLLKVHFLQQIVAARALNHEHQMDLLTSIMAMMADEPFKVCSMATSTPLAQCSHSDSPAKLTCTICPPAGCWAYRRLERNELPESMLTSGPADANCLPVRLCDCRDASP